MGRLKQISDQERMNMIHNFLLDDSQIMFPESYRIRTFIVGILLIQLEVFISNDINQRPVDLISG